jgi:hypothetical protein
MVIRGYHAARLSRPQLDFAMSEFYHGPGRIVKPAWRGRPGKGTGANNGPRPRS